MFRRSDVVRFATARTPDDPWTVPVDGGDETYVSCRDEVLEEFAVSSIVALGNLHDEP
jgi:hypothetical protein